MLHLTFEDFVEALARITTFKPLPTQRDFDELSARSGARVDNCAEFFDALHREGGKAALAAFNDAHEVDWAEAETERGRPLAETLELVLDLVIRRLDQNNDRKLTAVDWVGKKMGAIR